MNPNHYSVDCPRCGAAKGELCVLVGKRNPVQAMGAPMFIQVHAERRELVWQRLKERQMAQVKK